MADDPRIGEALNVLWRFHDVGARKEDAEHLVEQVDVKDPLRALLADEDALVEFATRARHKASGYDTWDEWPAWAQENWRAETRKLCWPVLAALREVANGGG